MIHINVYHSLLSDCERKFAESREVDSPKPFHCRPGYIHLDPPLPLLDGTCNVFEQHFKHSESVVTPSIFCNQIWGISPLVCLVFWEEFKMIKKLKYVSSLSPLFKFGRSQFLNKIQNATSTLPIYLYGTKSRVNVTFTIPFLLQNVPPE